MYVAEGSIVLGGLTIKNPLSEQERPRRYSMRMAPRSCGYNNLDSCDGPVQVGWHSRHNWASPRVSPGLETLLIRGVFFDFHGTLFVQRDERTALDEWITELHSRLTSGGLSIPIRKVWDYFHGAMWSEHLQRPDNGMTIFERRIQMTASDFGASLTRTEIEDTAEALIAVWDKYAQLDPAVNALLDALRERGKVLALISNYDHPRHLHDVVQRMGLKDRFAAVIVSGDHGIHKPDPAIFQLALESTAIRANEAMYVGDSEEDVIGANSSGLISILIDRGGHGRDYGQQHTVRSLREVLLLCQP